MSKNNRYAPHATDARQRALAAEGDQYPTGWCLRWVATDVLGVPGTTDWTNRSADCHDFWEAAKANGTVVETSDPAKIPADSMVMFAGEPHGHSGYALDDGLMVSTDFPVIGRIGVAPIAELVDRWGFKLVGAILEDGNGYLYQPRPADAPRVFVVTNPDGAPGRTEPRLSAPLRARSHKKPGARLNVAHMEQHGFTGWARVGKSTWYQLADLRRV